MQKWLLRVCLCTQIAFLFSFNAYATTVDDIRDMMGKDRLDDKYSQNEIAEVLHQRQQIEIENMRLKLFSIGEEIDIDTEIIEEYQKLNGELEKQIDVFANSFCSGEPINSVFINKSKVESLYHKIDSLREVGYKIHIEYIPNIWDETYEEVTEAVQEIESYTDIGKIGKEMLPPCYGNLKLISLFGPRLNRNNYDSVEIHNGIDIAVPLGTSVTTQWSGVVSKIYKTESMGNVVEITHGKNMKSVYGSIGNICVKEGQKVNQYDIIGKVAPPMKIQKVKPYLHFGVYLDGNYVNPIYFYGINGLNALKEYASTYTSGNSQLMELEDKIKDKPTKETEVENEIIPIDPMSKVERPTYNRKETMGNIFKYVPIDPNLEEIEEETE